MIYTFYSFKGGVGRSMALANLAECFYEKGLRVLVVDWDLEAPGVENYFYSSPATESSGSYLNKVKALPGLIDMLLRYKRVFSSLPRHEPMDAAAVAAGPPENLTERARQVEEAAAITKTFLEKLNIPEELRRVYFQTSAASPTSEPKNFSTLLDESLPPVESYFHPVHTSERAGLWLLTAGNRQEDQFGQYAAAVQEFDWLEFYAMFEGKEYFDWLRAKLCDFADVVLIDSRTGVTEMGGVCTRQMADAVVSFCSPNFQNIDGVVKIVSSLDSPAARKARADRDLQSLVIPTRIDDSESGLLGEFSASFQDKIEVKDRLPLPLRSLHRPMWSLQIPYVPRYNYKEQLVIGPGMVPSDPPSQKLGAAYRKIAAHLAVLAPQASRLFQNYASDIAVYFPQLRPEIVISCAADYCDSERLRQVLAKRELTVWPDLDHSDSEYRKQIDRALTLIVLLAPNEPVDGNVRREVLYARQQGKTVYLVTAGGVKFEFLPPWARSMVVYNLDEPEPLLRTLAVPRKAARVPFMAPSPVAGAIHRAEPYEQLRKRLHSTPVVVLSGAPGSGKSTLAAQVCRDDELLERFSDGVLWLEIGQAPDMATKWRELFIAIFGPETVPSDFEEIRRLVGSRLENGQFLLVLDDCWSYDRKELTRLGPSTTFLCITIDREVIGLGEDCISLSDLSQPEAAALLLGDTKLPPDDALPLLSAIGTSPIVVSLAHEALQRRLARNPAAPAEAILELQKDFERHGVIAFDDTRSSERGRSVARSVRCSLNMLDRGEQAFLFLLAGSKEPLLQFSDAIAILDLSEMKAVPLLRRFHNLYFIDYDPTAQQVRWNTLYWRYFQQSEQDLKRRQETEPRRQMSSEDWQTNPEVRRATAIIDRMSHASSEELLQLAKQLKNARYFDLARQLFALAYQAPEVQKDRQKALLCVQQQALCTYKNTQAPMNDRLAEALDLLQRHADLDSTVDPETLGIAGGITKEQWKYDGQRATLDRSLAYYLRGSEAGVSADEGYTALNAAFILDVLASEELKSGASLMASMRRQQARELRERIVAELPTRPALPGKEYLRSQWWFLVTLGEAYFGLGRHDEALFRLKEALLTPFSEWEYESTARQLAALLVIAELQGLSHESLLAARETLRAFLGNDSAVVEGVRLGKVGLALSGGGFRAALFHIGVLARLAELDFLRHVEVLSCVSGGSIIGAHYYLEVRRLLNSKPDHRITRQDYIDIVKRIETEFVAGVQHNIRTRVATNWLANLKTALLPGYSRTNRLGELYESEIYSRVTDGEGSKRYLNCLTITPPDESPNFSPKQDNWRRSAKAPVLVINATTLNTGHNWQFTVTWMGEPPSSIVSEINCNDRLRRLYYWQAPDRYQKVRLGEAVAASSCVPGLFEPIALPGLYPERTVQLVDGGVQDNQGISSLIDQECTVMLVSDASGQMNTVRRPSTQLLSVPLRSMAILQARVREADYLDLHARWQSSLLRGLFFVHLKRDLAVNPIGWIGESTATPRRDSTPFTPYGIDVRLQEQLSAIRTDLDSFHDTEAAALMLSGYRMTDRYFADGVPALGQERSDGRESWRFLELESVMTGAAGYEDVRKRLKRLISVSSRRGFKVWRLSPLLCWTGVAALLTLVASLCWKAWEVSQDLFLMLMTGVIFVDELQAPALISTTVLIILFGFYLIWRLFHFPKSLTQSVIGLLLIPGSAVAWLHLALFDPLYLAWGKLGPKSSAALNRARARFVITILVAVFCAIALFGVFNHFNWTGSGEMDIEKVVPPEQHPRGQKTGPPS